MNLKLPLEVEVPDELRVDDYTLTCKQVSEWEAVYRSETINDHYAPSINIDLSSGSIRGEFLGKEYSDSFDVTGDYLYENLLSMAEEMSQSVNKEVKKSKSQPISFSDMVVKQRGKNIKKYTINEVEDYPEYIRDYETLKKEIFKFLGPYDNNDFLQLIFSAIAVDSIEYRRLWDEYCNRFN